MRPISAQFMQSELLPNGDTVCLTFQQASGQPLTLAIDLTDLDKLAAGLLAAGQAAHEKKPRVPPLNSKSGPLAVMDYLSVNEWRVFEIDPPNRPVALHVLARGGLVLTLGFLPEQARFAGEALQVAARESSHPSTERR